MRLYEFVDDDDVVRDYSNPLNYDADLLDDAWDVMDDADHDVMSQYKLDHNIDDFPNVKAMAAAMNQARFDYGKVANVPIDKIYASEEYLEAPHMAKMKKGSAKASSKLPLLYKVNGKLVIGDGNHRVAAAKISGAKHIKALVVNP